MGLGAMNMAITSPDSDLTDAQREDAGIRGGAGLTLLGALTIGYLQKILSLNAFSTETRLMLTGVILIGAVLLQRKGAP